MDAYFGPNGIEYTVGRIPMGSCDFSVEEYSFDDVPGDFNLTHFDDGVERDSAQRVRYSTNTNLDGNVRTVLLFTCSSLNGPYILPSQVVRFSYCNMISPH